MIRKGGREYGGSGGGEGGNMEGADEAVVGISVQR